MILPMNNNEDAQALSSAESNIKHCPSKKYRGKDVGPIFRRGRKEYSFALAG